MVYMHNTSAILPSLERELTGRKIGDVFDLVIYPEDGYGYANDELIQTVPRDVFTALGEINVGMRVNVKSKDGESQLVTVKAINDDTVVVDGNHPLAGQVLHFEIGILAIREPTAAEIEQGFAADTNTPASGAGANNA